MKTNECDISFKSREIVFISQPFSGMTEEEVMNERDKIVKWLSKTMGDDREYVVIDQYHQPEPLITDNKVIRVWYLGSSIRKMSSADLIVFSENWKNAKGCKIEHKVAEEYGMKYIELSNGWDDILKEE